MVTNTTSILQKENARLHAENDSLRGELRNLHEFVQTLSQLHETTANLKSDAELLPLLNGLLYKALGMLDAPDGSLMLIDDETHELVFMLAQGSVGQDLIGYRIPADEGIAGWVVTHRQPVMVRDVRRDTRFSGSIDDAFKFRTQSIAAAPLIGDQKVLGVIEALNQPGDEPFDEMDLALLGLLCRFAGESLADLQRIQPDPIDTPST